MANRSVRWSQTQPGRVYSAKDVEDTIIALTEHVAGLGYAFAQVTPRGDRNFENRTISVTYTIDQGPRTYVERIEIRGNARTRDYVVRREFDVSEGDAFNQVLIQRAKRRLERLGYFETVEISTAPGSEPDQVILVVDLVEKSTGEFSIGAGYSTGGDTAGPSIEGSITEKNFLGRGQYIRVSAGGGENSRDFMLSFTEPYFLGRRIAAGFDIFRQTRRYDNYESETNGATVRFGLPITETLSTQIAYNYSEERYEFRDNCLDDGGTPQVPSCNVSQAIIDGVAEQPLDEVVGERHAALQHHRRHEEPARGPLCDVHDRVCRSGRRCRISEADRPWNVLLHALRRDEPCRPSDRRRRPYFAYRRQRSARVRLLQEQRSHNPRFRVQRHRTCCCAVERRFRSPRRHAPTSALRPKCSSRSRSSPRALA